MDEGILKLKDILKIVGDLEKSGQGFFQRGAGDSMHIFIRDADWGAARDVEKKLKGAMRLGIKPDVQSGTLLIELPDAYSTKRK